MFPLKLVVLTTSVPLLTVVRPVKVFAPVKVRVARPDFLNSPVPLITPAKVPFTVWLNCTTPLLAMLPEALTPLVLTASLPLAKTLTLPPVIKLTVVVISLGEELLTLSVPPLRVVTVTFGAVMLTTAVPDTELITPLSVVVETLAGVTLIIPLE